MKRSTAIEQTALTMTQILAKEITQQDGLNNIKYLSFKSGVPIDELLDDANVLIQAEIELNKVI